MCWSFSGIHRKKGLLGAYYKTSSFLQEGSCPSCSQLCIEKKDRIAEYVYDWKKALGLVVYRGRSYQE